MLTKRRDKIRFTLSVLILAGAVCYWGYTTIFTDTNPDAVWDILMVAIVISASFVVFGEERFSAALGESRDLTEPDDQDPDKDPDE